MGDNNDRPLAPMQARFCEEYIIDLNATQAAIRAGYSAETAHSQGPRLLENVGVAKRLAELKLLQSKRTMVTADYVLNTIVDTIERCKQAEQVLEWCPIQKAMVPSGEWKFEHNGVLKGCELLGKHLKLYTDKIEHSGKIEDMTDSDIEARIEEKLKKLSGKNEP